MLLTGTVHPPGGASAVLAATSPEIIEMGWYFVGIVMWGTTLMLLAGLVINNIQRQFPIYWWTPLDVRRIRKADVEVVADATGGLEERASEHEEEDKHYESDEQKERPMVISISTHKVTLPEYLAMSQAEIEVLKTLQLRLRKGPTESHQSRSTRSSAEVTIVPSHGMNGSGSDRA
jgi:hypothetical protein